MWMEDHRTRPYGFTTGSRTHTRTSGSTSTSSRGSTTQSMGLGTLRSMTIITRLQETLTFGCPSCTLVGWCPCASTMRAWTKANTVLASLEHGRANSLPS
ncbi:unnamed protein product [Ixodes pacificus]